MTMSYQGMQFTLGALAPTRVGLYLRAGNRMKTMMIIRPKKLARRMRSSQLANRFMPMQNRENAMKKYRTSSRGVPVKIRVFDSRSYFFIMVSMSSIGSAVSCAALVRSSVAESLPFFLNKTDPSSFSDCGFKKQKQPQKSLPRLLQAEIKQTVGEAP